MQRIHTNARAKIISLRSIQESENSLIGLTPVKNTVDRSLIIKIFVYSAIKMNANKLLLYSVLNPDTSSDSPSAKSNGVRLVSARFVMNQMINKGRTIVSTQDFMLMDIEFISMDWWMIRALSRIKDIDTS